jgi:hypothetical protein
VSGTKRKAGQLGEQVEGYQAWLAQRGHTTGTIRNMLKDLGQVGLWLSAEGLKARESQRGTDGSVPLCPARLGRTRSPTLARWFRSCAIASRAIASTNAAMRSFSGLACGSNSRVVRPWRVIFPAVAKSR